MLISIFELDGVSYYYVRNLLGDVTGVIDTSGSLVAQYTYDSWGKVLSTTGSMANAVGTLNPIRYRIEKLGFSPKRIHKMNNMVAIDKEVHRKISAHYSSKQEITNNLTVRNWLAGQSFEMQYNYGMDIYMRALRGTL